MKHEPVSSETYSEEYFLESCGGVEFFRLYGPKVPKPTMTHALKRAALRPGLRVLDIGCGRGEILYQARAAGALPVGTDYAEAALRVAAKTSGCPVALCDAKALPFRSGLFDRIFFIGIIDHLHDWELERCFADMARVLRPDGFVIIHTCTNRHYFKTLTYGLRRRLARLGRAVGLPARDPRPPRTGEDEVMHINEHSAGDLARFFGGIGWRADVEPVPNYKFLLTRLYGRQLPEGFPLRPMAAWRSALYMGLLFRFPLDRILAREFLVVARPPARETPTGGGRP
ncbi:MAG: class I SAM-dependent methyltransferase [Elusimicrobiota bacterium]